MNPLRLISICVNNSTHSSTLRAIVRPRILCRAVRVNRPGPLPQLSYIFETILIRSIVGTLWLIKYKVHSKYSRKSISPHKSWKHKMIEISSWLWNRQQWWKNVPYQKYGINQPSWDHQRIFVNEVRILALKWCNLYRAPDMMQPLALQCLSDPNWK